MNAVLDTQQDIAVVCKEPRIALVAGPGSGKTSTLVARILFLIKEGVDPGRMVVITFTNAAADELKARLGAVGDQLRFVGTLHAFCFDLLNRFPEVVGLREDITIATAEERIHIMQTVCGEQKVKFVKKLLESDTELNPSQATAVREYSFRLRRWNMVDFNTILVLTHQLAMRLTVEQTAIDHLLVDEVQDSGGTDWDIYEAIRTRNLFVVGDPDQSIYGFRGARPDLMRRFCANAGTKTIILDSCYRCADEICQAATRLIRHNKERIAKDVNGALAHAGSIEWAVSNSDEAEATALRDWIKGWEGTWEECAVICPTNGIVERTTELLGMLGLPIRRSEKRSLSMDFEKALQMIAWAVQPRNDFRGERVMQAMGRNPAEYISRAKLEGTTLAKVSGMQLPESLSQVPFFLAKGGITMSTIANIEDRIKEASSISELLFHMTADEAPEAPTESPGITVCTIHKAKGREWNSVAVLGLEEGQLPGKTAERLEEWRRFFFVAITRARSNLLVCSAAKRRASWGGSVEWGGESRFVREARG
jgi:DNA helicase II / ATP-dependent DNA helicase PcrA